MLVVVVVVVVVVDSTTIAVNIAVSLGNVLCVKRNITQLFCRFECRKLVLVGDPKVSNPHLFSVSAVRLYMSRQLNCTFAFFFSLFFFQFTQQLSPTIQGSEPDHEAGLEQTLFDRLIKMVSSIKPYCLAGLPQRYISNRYIKPLKGLEKKEHTVSSSLLHIPF